MALAVFDIDGTLVRGAGTEKRLFAGLFRGGWIRAPQLSAFIGFAWRHAGDYGSQTMKKNKAYLDGLRCAAVEEWTGRWVRRVASTWWYGPTVQRLQQHVAAGDRVVLLSGTPQFLAEAVAAALVGDRNPVLVVGTQLAAANGRFLRDPPPVHPFFETKRQLFEELCASRGESPADAHAYADTAYDLPLLRAVGHPVAVRPDRRLLHAARSCGWEILGER